MDRRGDQEILALARLQVLPRAHEGVPSAKYQGNRRIAGGSPRPINDRMRERQDRSIRHYADQSGYGYRGTFHGVFYRVTVRCLRIETLRRRRTHLHAVIIGAIKANFERDNFCGNSVSPRAILVLFFLLIRANGKLYLTVAFI